jgi:aryl-alcohol dehydrogenase-like predicted oxidoreductase
VSRGVVGDGLHLGLGLLSIGRAWGVAGAPVPSDTDAHALLCAAHDAGIGIFDTAPAYAASERRLGRFLRTLPHADRDRVVIMTKVGEHWSGERGEAFVDHGYDAMAGSLDASIALLGRIDVLQLHKATEDAIASPATAAIIERARSLGVRVFGASVGSVAAGVLALSTGLFSTLQFPFNATAQALEPLLGALDAAGGFAIVNRPYAMGGLVLGAADPTTAGAAAFGFLRERVTRGVVLTGTGKIAHLAENVRNFRAAMA